MANEDFTTYTETDPNNRFTVTASRVTFTGLTAAEIAYVYKDLGVDFFSGDLTHFLTFRASAQSAIGGNNIWALTNDIGDWQGLADGLKSMVCVQLNSSGADRKIYLSGLNAGSQVGDSVNWYTYSFNTTYYLTVKIDRSVGANGTIYLDIYSDAARTTLLNSQSYGLTAAQNIAYRYIYAIMSRNYAEPTLTVSGFTEDFELLAALTFIPKVFIL